MNIYIYIYIYIYISYEPERWSKDLETDFVLGNCLFGSVKLTKNVEPGKYKYSGYDIGFDCLGNISKDFTFDNMKKTGLKRKCKFFFC